MCCKLRFTKNLGSKRACACLLLATKLISSTFLTLFSSVSSKCILIFFKNANQNVDNKKRRPKSWGTNSYLIIFSKILQTVVQFNYNFEHEVSIELIGGNNSVGRTTFDVGSLGLTKSLVALMELRSESCEVYGITK